MSIGLGCRVIKFVAALLRFGFCLPLFGQTPSRPRIIVQPKRQIVPAGEFAEFEVVATGSDSFQYAWYHFDHQIGPQEGGDQRVLRLGPVSRTHDWLGFYSVVVQNGFGARRSFAARLVVVDPPQIMLQPASSNVLAGRTVRLAVRTAFDGFPKTFQWYRNEEPIDGAARRTLWLRRIQPEQAGTYKVVIQNFGGTTTSDSAIVQVE